MKLEEIGFYTLSNERASFASEFSDLQRCEIILTDRCNFKCTYCKGLKSYLKNDIPFSIAEKTLNIWCDHKLKNLRFSGGEPTLYERLPELITIAKSRGVERIAISTNGSASWDYYQNLIDLGVNDFSISLDSGCCSIANKISGQKQKSIDLIAKNIQKISQQTYVTIGMVFTEDNLERCKEEISFADSLGPSDIRVIPSAQYNKALIELTHLPKELLEKYQILRYRINNIKKDIPVRGLTDDNNNKCWLAIDDMAVAGNYHFPCIIYLREGGAPIGKVSANIRQERAKWIKTHSPIKDKVCKTNCLDVCRLYNETAHFFKEE